MKHSKYIQYLERGGLMKRLIFSTLLARGIFRLAERLNSAGCSNPLSMHFTACYRWNPRSERSGTAS